MISPSMRSALAQTLHEAVQMGVQVGVVCGAGNIFRARSANLEVVQRVTADHVGMLENAVNRSTKTKAGFHRQVDILLRK